MHIFGVIYSGTANKCIYIYIYIYILLNTSAVVLPKTFDNCPGVKHPFETGISLLLPWASQHYSIISLDIVGWKISMLLLSLMSMMLAPSAERNACQVSELFIYFFSSYLFLGSFEVEVTAQL